MQQLSFGPVPPHAAAAAAGSPPPQTSDSYSDLIIRPPERNVTHGHKNKRFVVDSNNRNRILYPNSAECEIRFDQDYQDVTSIELVQGFIPYIQYTITNFNNKLYIQESTSTVHTITIDPGVYTMSTLIATIQTSINALTLTHTYVVSQDPVTLQINFAVTWGTTTGLPLAGLRFGRTDTPTPQYLTGSIGRTLGFTPETHYTLKQGTVSGTNGGTIIYGTGTHFNTDYQVGDTIYIENHFATPYTIASIEGDLQLTLTAPLGFSFTDLIMSTNYILGTGTAQLLDPTYLILEIREAKRLESSEDAIIDTFAVIPRINSDGKIWLRMGTLPAQREIKYFNPPIRLQKMKFTFYYPDGTVADFYGQEFMLDFSMTLLNQAGKYNSINSGTSAN